ncbi:hypothetical protein [Lacipirellula sp.]
MERQRSYGATVQPLSNADDNGDGVIDGSDLNTWRNVYQPTQRR